MRIVAFLLALLLQVPQSSPLAALRATLQRLAADLDQHKATYGAAPDLTVAKHALRDWVESQVADLGERADTRAFAVTMHAALRDANLLCDDCDWNVLGYVDDVRVERTDGFLVIVTSTGISCGYDESAYVYAWDGRQWRRIWELERNTYTQKDYLPQMVHDVQISAPDASSNRTLMLLGSQTICGGSFKDLYAQAWRLDAGYRAERVLDWTGYGNDGVPPLRGRVLPDDVLFVFAADGIASGDAHTAVRHFTIGGGAAARQTDPVAGLPHDFVLEWLDAPWDESRAHSASPSLETWHTELHNKNHVGDFAQPTVKCTAGADLWQVSTHLFESPRRYYRVRWQPPMAFTMVDVSETPYPDCTTPDSRGNDEPDILSADLR
jgi:hypothetical protein